MDYLLNYIDSGGWVMYPLVLFTLLLWYAMGYRYSLLRRAGHKQNARALVERYLTGHLNRPGGMVDEAVVRAMELRKAGARPLRKYLDEAFWPYHEALGRYSVLIRTIVVTAPLLGLLGTVGGMIETFDSLQEMALFSQSGGIAGGISQALITTQFGLGVAIPGLFINGFIERRRQYIEVELVQVKDIVSSLSDERIKTMGE